MSIRLSDLSNLQELELQELSDEESQLISGGNLFGGIVGGVIGGFVGSRAGIAGALVGGVVGYAAGSVAEDFINGLLPQKEQVVTIGGIGASAILSRRI
ncbi:MAG: hypothetical protein RMX96_34860 [Nostoc sp. ChiSLP02]|nr:hypothetical protein [Nostoc sp. DedSLP05]MDZ8102089.1 hypothetical protein [Nostoc sp. DedSLP01]MDZ8190004.1 hypothetical protein [Nostoc sp. ChiSLP02]